MANLTQKWIDLLSALHWQGIDNWKVVRPDYLGTAIPEMKEWIREHIQYVEPKYVTRGFWPYYFHNKTYTGGDIRYRDRDFVTIALAALYKYQQENKQDG